MFLMVFLACDKTDKGSKNGHIGVNNWMIHRPVYAFVIVTRAESDFH